MTPLRTCPHLPFPPFLSIGCPSASPFFHWFIRTSINIAPPPGPADRWRVLPAALTNGERRMWAGHGERAALIGRTGLRGGAGGGADKMAAEPVELHKLKVPLAAGTGLGKTRGEWRGQRGQSPATGTARGDSADRGAGREGERGGTAGSGAGGSEGL